MKNLQDIFSVTVPSEPDKYELRYFKRGKKLSEPRTKEIHLKPSNNFISVRSNLQDLLDGIPLDIDLAIGVNKSTEITYKGVCFELMLGSSVAVKLEDHGLTANFEFVPIGNLRKPYEVRDKAFYRVKLTFYLGHTDQSIGWIALYAIMDPDEKRAETYRFCGSFSENDML
jgi:hypothetical protein